MSHGHPKHEPTEQQRTTEPYCEDPSHSDSCDCGADPDREYERRLDK